MLALSVLTFLYSVQLDVLFYTEQLDVSDRTLGFRGLGFRGLGFKVVRSPKCYSLETLRGLCVTSRPV